MSQAKKRSLTAIGWLVCSLGAIFYSYEYLLRISPSVMEDALRAHFNLSATGFGTLSAFYYYAYVPMQVPVGIFMDRFGPKRLLTFACFVCVIGTLLFAATSLFWVSAAGRFLVGFGSSFAFVGVLKLATIWLPEDRLAMVSGLASALGTVGAMIGDNLLDVMVNSYGWKQTINLTAVVGAVLTVFLWLGIRDHTYNEETSGTVANFKRGLVDFGVIVRNKQIWINGLYGCLVYLPTTVLAELWGIPYLQHAHGMTLEAAGFANSLLFFGFMIGAPSMGFISDYLRRRKMPMLLGASGAALVMMIILYVPNLSNVQIGALMFLLGLLYSAQAIVFAVGRELSPSEAAGTAMALTNMIVMLGATFLQPFVGRLLDWSVYLRDKGLYTTHLATEKMQLLYTADDYQFALSVIPLGILIAAFLTFFLKETHAHAE